MFGFFYHYSEQANLTEEYSETSTMCTHHHFPCLLRQMCLGTRTQHKQTGYTTDKCSKKKKRLLKSLPDILGTGLEKVGVHSSTQVNT